MQTSLVSAPKEEFSQVPLPFSSVDEVQEDAQPMHGPSSVILPHPWTGVAPVVQVLFTGVASLVRRSRNSTLEDRSYLNYMSLTDSDPCNPTNVRKAEIYEEELLSFNCPSKPI